MTPEREAQIRAEARDDARAAKIRMEEYEKAYGYTALSQWRIALVAVGAAIVGGLLAGLAVRGCHL